MNEIKTMIEALRILSHDIQSGDGVANACVADAANMIESLSGQLAKANESALFYKEQYEKTGRECTKLAMRESKANERVKELELPRKRNLELIKALFYAPSSPVTAKKAKEIEDWFIKFEQLRKEQQND